MELEQFYKASDIVGQIREEEEQARFFRQYSLVGLKLYNDDGMTITISDDRKQQVSEWLAKAAAEHQIRINELKKKLKML